MLAAKRVQHHVGGQKTSSRPTVAAFRSVRGRAVAAVAKMTPANQADSTTGEGLYRRQLMQAALLLTLASGTAPAAMAADPIETVFVAGATGNTGRRVVQQLRAAGFKVKAGVRDVRKAQSLGFSLDSGITLEVVDVTKPPEALLPAIQGAQAVICATGFSGFNPAGVSAVEEAGTMHLIDAAKAAGVSNFVYTSSLLTNAVAMGQKDNPNYKVLNLFGGVLDHKLAAEQYLRASGLKWTIVRPAGLSNDPPEKIGKLLVASEDTWFGLDGEPGREISRDTVASVLVAALQQPAAVNKVVEIVGTPTAPELAVDKWFDV